MDENERGTTSGGPRSLDDSIPKRSSVQSPKRRRPSHTGWSMSQLMDCDSPEKLQIINYYNPNHPSTIIDQFYQLSPYVLMVQILFFLNNTYLVDGFNPSTVGMIIPNVWKIKTCSKTASKYGGFH